MGDRLESALYVGPQGADNAGYDPAADIAERARRIEARQHAPDFEETEFDGYVVDCKIRPGGDLEIRIGVPKADKWDALKLSDASGIMVSFHCVRRYRSGNKLARNAGYQQSGDPDDGEEPSSEDETYIYGSGRPDAGRHLRVSDDGE